MAYDFERQIREMQQGKAIPVPAELPAERPAIPSAEPQIAVAITDQQDPDAVDFPMHWWGVAGFILAILGIIGWIIHSAIAGRLDQSLLPVYLGGAGILFLLAKLPNSLRIDRHGVHQVYFLGLWQRTLPISDVAYYWQTTRRELRQAGLLRFEWRQRRQQGDAYEPVVFVASKSSRRYLMHTSIHQRASDFAKQLHDRGIAPKGYEGWESFMAARGVTVREG